jgi:hypothetical protein
MTANVKVAAAPNKIIPCDFHLWITEYATSSTLFCEGCSITPTAHLRRLRLQHTPTLQTVLALCHTSISLHHEQVDDNNDSCRRQVGKTRATGLATPSSYAFITSFAHPEQALYHHSFATTDILTAAVLQPYLRPRQTSFW